MQKTLSVDTTFSSEFPKEICRYEQPVRKTGTLKSLECLQSFLCRYKEIGWTLIKGFCNVTVFVGEK